MGPLTKLCLALVLGSLALACGAEAEPELLRIHAAASLRDVFEALAEPFEAEHGVRVRISTGGSNLIAQQLLAGAEADLFVPADRRELELLEAAGLIAPGSGRDLFTNELVVVVPAARAGAEDLKDFETSDLLGCARIAIAHAEAVPAGRHAAAWLASEGLWDELESRTVQTLDVRAALAAVASDAVDAGIVYRTDAASSDAVRVVLTASSSLATGAPAVRYPGAVLAGSARPDLARAFLAAATGSRAELVRSFGFGVLGE